jgi:uncharacterized protein involved in tolerance to divalent cations
MINVIIHLKTKHNSKELIKHLLSEKLIASASIDENNISYKMVEGILNEEVYNVITAQTKALLFNDIVETVEGKLGERIAINSTPIVGSSGYFYDTIETKTSRYKI